MSISTIVIILLLAVIAVFSVKSYAKKLTSGCCGSGGDTEKRVKVRDKNPAHYPQCVKIGIDGMTCAHCRQRVENALNSEDGVWAEVDLKDESAIVHMKNALSEDSLRYIISRAGYTATYVEEIQGR